MESEILTSIVNAASFLQIGSILKVCSELLCKEVNQSNAVEFHKFAFEKQLPHLLNYTRKYTEWHFTQLSSIGKLNKLSYMEFVGIIKSCELKVDREFEVFVAVSRWVSRNPRERGPLVKSLLQHVRLSLLSPAELNEVRNNAIVKSCKECLQYIDLIKSTEGTHQNRYTSHKLFDLLVFGGKHNFSQTNSFCKLKSGDFVETEEFRPIVNLDKILCGTMIGTDIYFFGVEDSCNRFYVYSIETKKIKKLSTLKNKEFPSYSIFPFSICSYMGRVYVLGGVSNKESSSACDMYDPDTDKWKHIASMQTPRRDAACVVFDGRIHMLGGREGYEMLSSVECYDHLSDTWTYKPSMNIAKDFAAAVAIKDKLYVLGTHMQWSFEVYDKNSNEFTFVKEANRSETYFRELIGRVVAVGNKILVVGGYYETPCGLVHTYNVTTGMWSSSKHGMPRYRSGFGCLKMLKDGL